MKSKFITLILILIFLITFVIFFKGLKNSSIYTPDTNLKIGETIKAEKFTINFENIEQEDQKNFKANIGKINIKINGINLDFIFFFKKT